MTLPLNLYVDKELLKSKAFRELSKTKYAYLVLFEFNIRAKRGLKNPKKKKNTKNYILENNGQLRFSYTEAEDIGISRPQFAKIIKLLVGVGFLDRRKRGGNLDGDHSLYAISDRWKMFGTHRFIEKTIEKDIRAGKGWSRYHEKNKEKKQ